MKNHNGARFRPGDPRGHYESFFLRANHPQRPLAFWIRYTVFSPKSDPARAIGELWAVISNHETGATIGVKKELPIAGCRFDRDELDVKIGEAKLDERGLQGEAASGDHEIRWKLRYYGDAKPVLLLPERLYRTALPKAKSLVGLPMATFNGELWLDGEVIDVEGWTGSQNHNWGSQHTHRYAFGQVAGFDDAPDTFLEVVTAKARIAGPIMTPELTTLVLRHDGADYSLVSVRQARRAQARYGYFHWEFSSGDPRVRISGRIEANRDAFVGLRYNNPPGGVKYCLNTKIGSAELTIRDRQTGRTTRLRAANRALFEILTDDTAHGVPLRA